MSDVHPLVCLGTLAIFITGALFIILSVVFLPALRVWQRRHPVAIHRPEA
jgi:hypothetical protein